MRYISHYEEYPIYEPEEGGYYYPGNQLVASKRKSKRACKKNLLEIWEECKQDNAERGFRENNEDEWKQIIRNTHEYPWYFDRERNYIYKDSYLIGEGESYVIERNQGSQECKVVRNVDGSRTVKTQGINNNR